MFPNSTLILGGASSGKSSFAETLVKSNPGSHVYLASALSGDSEMMVKIERHQKQRGSGWETVEEPLDVASALGQRSAGYSAGCHEGCSTNKIPS